MALSETLRLHFSKVLLVTWISLSVSSSLPQGPRLKPVFVRKRDRVTLLEREKQEEKEKEMEEEKKRMTDIRRRETLKIIEQDNKKELEKDMDIDDKVGEA